MLAVSQFETGVSVWTIRIALVCMFAVFGIRLAARMQSEKSYELAKSLWLLGSLLSLLHALTTMGFYHQFQHELALEDTARQTEAVIGIEVGIGIYFNYVFVMMWLTDAMWWIGFSSNYVSRPAWINWTVYGFLAFIAINGAIVFESGAIRWFGIAALVSLAVIWFWCSGNSGQKNEIQT